MAQEQKFSHYTVRTDEVTNAEGKRYLSVGISNGKDDYDGITLYLSPGDAKILSKEIYQAARAMEQQPKKKEKK